MRASSTSFLQYLFSTFLKVTWMKDTRQWMQKCILIFATLSWSTAVWYLQMREIYTSSELRKIKRDNTRRSFDGIYPSTRTCLGRRHLFVHNSGSPLLSQSSSEASVFCRVERFAICVLSKKVYLCIYSRVVNSRNKVSLRFSLRLSLDPGILSLDKIIEIISYWVNIYNWYVTTSDILKFSYA